MNTEIRARFRIHVRCENCTKEASSILDVPNVEDAPGDIEELLDSAFLAQQRFVCRGCETPIGIIAGIAKLRIPEAEYA